VANSKRSTLSDSPSVPIALCSISRIIGRVLCARNSVALAVRRPLPQ